VEEKLAIVRNANALIILLLGMATARQLWGRGGFWGTMLSERKIRKTPRLTIDLGDKGFQTREYKRRQQPKIESTRLVPKMFSRLVVLHQTYECSHLANPTTSVAKNIKRFAQAQKLSGNF
jgi:hypothetical protein